MAQGESQEEEKKTIKKHRGQTILQMNNMHIFWPRGGILTATLYFIPFFF